MNNTVKNIYVGAAYFILLFIFHSFEYSEEELYIVLLVDFLIHLGLFYTISTVLTARYYNSAAPQLFIALSVAFIVFVSFVELYPVVAFQEEYTMDTVVSKGIFPEYTVLKNQFVLNLSWLSLVGMVAALMGTSKKKSKDKEQGNLELKAENQFLKYQINPHFLFNSLNNIYSTSILKPEKVSNAIFELSELLSYTLYSSEKNNVTLKEEITHIEHFINTMKLKDSSVENVTFDYQSVDDTLTLSPMLLIPFIENAFKHGNITSSESGWLKITMKSSGNTFFFQCHNSIDTTPSNKDKTGGIGINNVKRRLDIIYPNKHQLSTTTLKSTFAVELNLELK